MKSNRAIILSVFIMLITLLIQGGVYEFVKTKESENIVSKDVIQVTNNISNIDIKEVYKTIKALQPNTDSVLRVDKGGKTSLTFKGDASYISKILNKIYKSNVEIMDYNIAYKEGIYALKIDVLFKAYKK